MPEIVGEYLDRVCAIEMRPGAGNLPRGVIHRLYDAARAWAGEPLTLQTARALTERVKPGDAVFLLTGAGCEPVLPRAEMDGLPGTATLARVLHFELGARVCVLTEERVDLPVQAVCRAAGMNVVRTSAEPMDHAVTWIPMPLDAEACRAQAPALLAEWSPSLVMGIEKLSPNRNGIIHGATGLSYDACHAKPQFLFDEAKRRGILTAGIGDGGNECGFGVIREAVEEVMPAGRACVCGCGGGTAASVATDVFVVSAISNWGAYAVSAMLCYLRGRASSMIDPDDLERMMRATVDAGAFDGALGRPTISDDGVPLKVQRGYVEMLRGVLEIGLSRLESPGH